MHCLWLTLADPDPPTNGQYLYSGALMRGLALAGAELDVVGFMRPEGRRACGLHEGRICWWLAEDHMRSPWAGLFSTLPDLAARMSVPETRDLLRQLMARLEDNYWDAIIFDSLSAAWALGPLLARCAALDRRPAFLYIAHNHEESLAPRVAAVHPHWLKRQIRRLDALKVTRLERSLARQCNVITANTPDDRTLFQAQWPHKRVELLLPSYFGRRIEHRRITSDIPRRAVMVGSLDWLPKRVNLEEFLAVADPLFAQAGVELQVVGNADEALLARLRRNGRATTFTGRVDDIGVYMKGARVGIVAERVGGGFKLKVLDYVFHRVPILALAGSAPGVPVRDGESIMLCNSHADLAQTVLRVIDDLPLLNRMQEAAFAACNEEFDLHNRGRQLFAWIDSLAPHATALTPEPAIVRVASPMTTESTVIGSR
jgi:glycosyltransferase involved in cell wall biosynthesis